MFSIFKTTFLLISLIWSVHSHDHTEHNPVNLLQLDHIVIDGYHGPMHAKAMELFGNVETVVLKNSNFSTFNEDVLIPLKNLKKFTIAHCHFERIKNNLTSCCKNLREFRVIEGDVDDVDKESLQAIAGMENLEKLYFLRVHAPVLMSDAMAGSHLKKMEIVQSNLATIEDGALNGMDKLEVLDLQRNKLKTVPTASLAAVKTLKELNLQGNLLEKVTTADIPSLPNLEKLNLGHNPIKEIDLTGLKEKLPNIKEVEVSGVDIDPSKAEGIPLVKKQIA